MRLTTDFSRDGAYAVVVGTSSHSEASSLDDLPSVSYTGLDVARVLYEVCGMDTSRITLLLDPEDDGAVVEAVEQAASKARGLLLFYFIGHGLLGPQDQLYLATRSSLSYERVARSVPYQSVRDMLSGCAARTVVVLDCCFSGLADAASRSRYREALAAARPDGSFLLSSASDYALSFAPEGARHTLFTGKLLSLLEHGSQVAPAWLTLDHLYAELDREFQSSTVRPHRLSEDRAGELVIAPNRGYLRPRNPPPDPTDDSPCPYPGMEPFRAEDGDRFFGREDLVADLLDAVAEQAATDPLMLIGASGVGKSSILRAGLLAGLERRYEADASTPWPALLLTAPGRHPARTLAERWAHATGRPLTEVERQFASGRLPGAVAGRAGCQVLVVDQFEEVFTQCQDADERALFVRVLCADHGGRGPRVVIALRADHYGSCLAHLELVRALRANSVIVPPLDDAGVRVAIELPARDTGLLLERGLTELLLRDVREGGSRDLGSALPFLAHALRETWARRSGATLTLAGYAATGGIWESVTKTAEEIHEGLAEPGRHVLRDMLLSMVHLRAGNEEVVRRRVGLDELVQGRQEPERQLVRMVSDQLARARLITVDQTTAQISHEALLRAWPRLKRWIDDDRAGLVIRQQLADAADEWLRAEREQAFCYRGARLATAVEWAREEGHRRLLRPLDVEFLIASRAVEQAELERERARTRRLRQYLAGVAIFLCLALVAGGVAFQRNAAAQRSSESAQTRQLEEAARADVTSDPRSALLLAVAAYRRAAGDRAARSTLLDVLTGTQFSGSVKAQDTGGAPLSYSPDGRTLVVGDGIGAAELFDVTGQNQVRWTAKVAARGQGGGFGFVTTWVGDAALMIIGVDGSLGRFSLTDRAHPKPMGNQSLASFLEGAGFSPDGSLLVTAPLRFGPASLWDVGSGSGPARAVAAFPTRPSSIQTITFSARGHLLALGWQDGTVELWNVADPSRPQSLGALPGTGGPAQAAEFSPDGTTLAVGSHDTQTRLWDLSDPSRPRRTAIVSGHGGPITAVAFSPDGHYLATGSTDRTAVVWDVSSRDQPTRTAVLTGQEVNGITFTRDGSTVVTGDPGGQLYFWTNADRLTPARAEQVAPLPRSAYSSQWMSVPPHALDPRGRLLALLTDDNQMILTPLTGPNAGRTAGTLPVGDRKHLEPQGVFSPDGHLLAITKDDGTTTVWDVSDPYLPKQHTQLRIDVSEVALSSLAFSQNGDWLAANVSHQPTTLWDISHPGHPVALARIQQPELGGGTVLFAPQGNLLAIGTELYSVADPHAPKQLATLPSPDGRNLPLLGDPSVFSPDARTLVLGGGANGLLFDVSSPGKPRYLGQLNGADDSFSSRGFAFSPDGHLIAGPGSRRQTRLWDVSDPSGPHPVASVDLGGNLRELAFSADGSTLTTYDDTHVATVWKTGPLSEAVRDPVSRACRLAGANPTQKEWGQIAPNIPFMQVCASLPAAPPPPRFPRLSPIPSAIPAGG